MTHRDMNDRRDAALAKATAITETANVADRNLTDEERADYDSAVAEAVDYRERIARADALAIEQGLTPASASQPDADPSIGMEPKELREYSLIRAINASVSGDWSKAGLERAASIEGQKHLEGAMRGTFVIPHDVLVEQRDVTVGTGDGDQLVATDLMAGSFIEALQNRMVVKAAGARIMSGLVGDVAIPKANAGATAYWVDEDAAITESTSTWTQVTLTPHTIGAFEDLSRKLLQQTTPAAEKLVRDDIAGSLARGIDLACLHGTNANDQPCGIAATGGIGSVAGGTNGLAPAWTHIVALETAVAIDNADIGSLAYITSAAVRGKMKETLKVASTDAVMLWAANNTPLNGYPAFVSNQVSDVLTKGTATAKLSAIFFGNWNDLLIGMWGGLDVLVNPYILSTTGQVRIQAFQSVDVAVRHAESFAAMLDAISY